MKPFLYLIIFVLFGIYAEAQKEIFDHIGKKLIAIETPETDIASKKNFYYFQLLKIDIDEKSRISTVSASDSSPVWFTKGLEKIKAKKLDWTKLNALAKDSNLKNCSLMLPIVIASEFYSTNMPGKAPLLNESLFKFNGKNLNGKIIFGDVYVIAHGADWKR